MSAAWEQLGAEGREAVLNLAITGLAKLVRDEYPSKYTLSEIADTWGFCINVSPEEVRAIDLVQRELEI